MALWCVGIAVDPEKRQFYRAQKGHSDSGEGRICRAEIGQDRKMSHKHEVVMTGLAETLGMAVFHDEGYTSTTSLTGEQFRARTNGSEPMQIGKFGQLSGIARF